MAVSNISTPAILLRRVSYGDYDLIITLLTLSEGKLTVMAKSAKKSIKRFGGALELFSILEVVCSRGAKSRMPILQEAVLTHPFSTIRSDIIKTAFASYWSEIVYKWMMEGKKEERIFHLLQSVLEELNAGGLSDPLLSLFFQSRFLTLSGLRPNMDHCMGCGKDIETVKTPYLDIDLHRGGLYCRQCGDPSQGKPTLSKGTIKLLSWIDREGLDHVRRIRCSSQSLLEGERFLETVIPYHLGKMPKSLVFLQKFRPTTNGKLLDRNPP